MLRAYNEKIVVPFRLKSLSRVISPYAKGSKTILDVGSSCGRLAHRISMETGAEMTGVDVHMQPSTAIPVMKYDGKRLPFAADTFDTVLLVDVLHHSENPEQIIKEAKRVARKSIIVKEFYWTNKLDFHLTKLVDWAGCKGYGMPLPYNFQKIVSMQAMFARQKLSIVEMERFRNKPLDLCRNVLFRLGK